MRKKLSPIRSETVQSKVYQRLRAALIAGHFAPNEELKLRDLAAELGCSIMPIREALHRLVSEKALVEDYSNRSSVRVPDISSEKFEDLIRVRKLVEGEAAVCAAANGDKTTVSRLVHLNTEFCEAREKGDIDRIIATNRRFHFEVYAKAGSDVLFGVIESLWLQSGAYFHSLIPAALAREASFSDDYHEQVIHALKTHDAEMARSAVIADIEDSAQLFRECLINGQIPANDKKVAKLPKRRGLKAVS